MKENCIFCNNEFEEFSIREYKNWDLQLFRDDQYYIGRSAIVFRNRHIVDLVNLNKNEYDELFTDVIPDLQKSLGKIFDPDLYNYSKIGNDCEHLHMHIVPRYKTSREFMGIKFEDEYWDQTYAQDYDRIKLNQNKISNLINILKNNME
jgi:diadenosine tetraphosphate (Ap4A) HIT family hydrolase